MVSVGGKDLQQIRRRISFSLQELKLKKLYILKSTHAVGLVRNKLKVTSFLLNTPTWPLDMNYVCRRLAI